MKEKKPNGYWNYDTCKEEAKKYKKELIFKKHVVVHIMQHERTVGWMSSLTN